MPAFGGSDQIGYVTIGTNELDRARSYYAALLGTIGAKEMMRIDDDTGFTMYGTGMDRPGSWCSSHSTALQLTPATAT